MPNPKTTNLGLNKIDRSSPATTAFNSKAYIDDNADIIDGKFSGTTATGHGHTGSAGDGPKIDSTGLVNGAATDTVIGNRIIDPNITTAYGLTGTITQLFSWLFKYLKSITGKANTFDAPDITLAAVKTHVDSGTAHGSTSSATANTIMQRDANGQANVGAPTAASHIARKQDVDAIRSDGTKSFVVEIRPADPVSPELGRIWFIS